MRDVKCTWYEWIGVSVLIDFITDMGVSGMNRKVIMVQRVAGQVGVNDDLLSGGRCFGQGRCMKS